MHDNSAPSVFLLFGRGGAPTIATPWLLLGLSGLLVGFGTRLGSGCTSGHGVCGLSRLSPRSAAEWMIRNAVITLAKQYPFARNLVNTGRLSSASTYTRSSINVGEWGGNSIQNVAIPKHDDLVGVMAQAQGNLLVIAPDSSTAASLEAKRIGLIDLRMSGEVVELNLSRLDPYSAGS